MKTKEELNALKNEVESLNKKLTELTDDELSEIFGGTPPALPATQLPDTEFSNMFKTGDALDKPASGLPATTLVGGEYAVGGSAMDKYELA